MTPSCKHGSAGILGPTGDEKKTDVLTGHRKSGKWKGSIPEGWPPFLCGTVNPIPLKIQKGQPLFWYRDKSSVFLCMGLKEPASACKFESTFVCLKDGMRLRLCVTVKIERPNIVDTVLSSVATVLDCTSGRVLPVQVHLHAFSKGGWPASRGERFVGNRRFHKREHSHAEHVVEGVSILVAISLLVDK